MTAAAMREFRTCGALRRSAEVGGAGGSLGLVGWLGTFGPCGQGNLDISRTQACFAVLFLARKNLGAQLLPVHQLRVLAFISERIKRLNNSGLAGDLAARPRGLRRRQRGVLF